jgi:hypothetical protein
MVPANRNITKKLIRYTVRQFMENEVRPGVRQRDREGRFPTQEIDGTPRQR